MVGVSFLQWKTLQSKRNENKWREVELKIDYWFQLSKKLPATETGEFTQHTLYIKASESSKSLA